MSLSGEQFIFRPWQDCDEEQILGLVRHNYGDIDTSHAEYFDWEYRRNPEGRATIICCLAEGNVVGMLAAAPVPIIFKGSRATGAVLVNGLTHPAYRRKGLFPECGKRVCEELKQRGIALSYGLPNPNSYPDLTQKIGYSDIGRACLLIRPHDPESLLSSRSSIARLPGLARLEAVLVKALLKKPTCRVPVEGVASFEGLPLERLREKANLALETDARWLAWRYGEIPRRQYHILSAGRGGRVDGVAVYRVSFWEDVKICAITDLFLAPDCELDVVETLLSRVFGECEAQRCAATFCLVTPRSRKCEMLKRVGFWAVPPRFEPQPFVVILQGHASSVSDIRVEDLDVSFGIYDVF